MSEDAAFQAVLDLVAAGEYLDQIPGVPMPSTDGGGAFQVTPDGRYRRIYYRGTPEYRQARDRGLVEPLPATLVPAREEAAEEAERVLGLPLPPLLRRLYLEVGNGGFGPGYGLLELSGGSEYTGLSMYRQAREANSRDCWSSFPPSLFPVCAWGCAIYSFIDCSSPGGPMWGYDPNPGPGDVRALYPQSLDLAGWLGRWVEGTLHQPWLIEDPITGGWRGATDDDYAQAFAEQG